jgi:hypothetical protein
VKSASDFPWLDYGLAIGNHQAYNRLILLIWCTFGFHGRIFGCSHDWCLDSRFCSDSSDDDV